MPVKAPRNIKANFNFNPLIVVPFNCNFFMTRMAKRVDGIEIIVETGK